MRHQDVTLASLSLALAIGSACALFAGRGSTREVAPSGSETAELVFARRCADCHDAQEFAATLRDSPDRGLSAIDMLDFLSVHGAASDAEDRALVRWFCAPEAH